MSSFRGTCGYMPHAVSQAPLPTIPLRAWATLVPWRPLRLASHHSLAPGTSKPTDLDNLRLGEAVSQVALLTFMVKARSDTEVLLRLESGCSPEWKRGLLLYPTTLQVRRMRPAFSQGCSVKLSLSFSCLHHHPHMSGLTPALSCCYQLLHNAGLCQSPQQAPCTHLLWSHPLCCLRMLLWKPSKTKRREICSST